MALAIAQRLVAGGFISAQPPADAPPMVVAAEPFKNRIALAWCLLSYTNVQMQLGRFSLIQGSLFE